ncbi:MAG: MaoC family dehydratase [Candidatus Eremiobacteraeota bacterium]|nr:MaoC family dehydratase [Candidatus Eremiobacteraeota bacterium]
MDFKEGASASLTHTVSAADVEAFAKVTGDQNPVHLDEAYAAETRFGRRIAHGMLAVSYISAILGTKFPGPGTIYLSQSVSFLAPVFLGDTITATVTVSKFRAEKGVLTLLTECWNQDGVKVVDGQAVVLVTDVIARAEAGRATAAEPARASEGTAA